MSYWDQEGVGIERGPNIDGERPHWGDFLTDTGRLSGSHLVTISETDPDLAAEILTDFADALPEDLRPEDLEGLLGFAEWSGEEQQTFLGNLEAMKAKEE